MKKIMFNDKYGLTDAVLQGRKTMTRRIIKQEVDSARSYNPKLFPEGYDSMAFYHDGGELWRLMDADGHCIKPAYKFGEAVVVAQSYKDLGYTKEWVEQHISSNPNANWNDPFEKKYPGWSNKMFVPAELNKAHQIRITDIKAERLQDISDDDVHREGFSKNFINNGWGNAAFHEESVLVYYDKLGLTKTIRSIYPKEAFAALIDKVSGKDTWNSNPYVFAYTFELVK